MTSSIPAGKTSFVRFIASEGWGWWRKQAPGWNDVTRLFADNEKVAFGDVNLSNAPMFRGAPHMPGQGGWPTIRYYNEETGPDGGAYTKVTDMAMCSELLDRMHMIDYVESYGNTVLCDLDGTNCNEQEVKYLEKYKDKEKAELKVQLQRVEDMLEKPMKDSLRLWAYRRIRILKRLLTAGVFQTPDL